MPAFPGRPSQSPGFGSSSSPQLDCSLNDGLCSVPPWNYGPGSLRGVRGLRYHCHLSSAMVAKDQESRSLPERLCNFGSFGRGIQIQETLTQMAKKVLSVFCERDHCCDHSRLINC